MKWFSTSLLAAALLAPLTGCQPQPLVVPGTEGVPGEDEAETPPAAGLTEDPGAPESETPAAPSY